MATINWKRLLDSKGVVYLESGAGVAKGNIVVACPFCGGSDFHYLGVSLTNSWWGCWRNQSHRGKSPVRLLVALLKISYGQALELAGLDASFVDPDGYESIKNNLFKKQEALEQSEPQTVTKLTMPKEFEEINPARIRHLRAFNYLADTRGFPRNHLTALCKYYHLRFAVAGDFKDRIILPYYMDGRLVTWTGRAVGETRMRYLDLSIAQSVLPAKRTFYNFNATCRPAKILLVQEGPMDSLKVDMYAKEFSVRSISISTNSITEDQTYLLEEVSVNFDKTLIMMDAANSMGVIDSMRLKEKLAQIKNIGFVSVPFGRKDGGELTPEEVVSFAKGLTQ